MFSRKTPLSFVSSMWQSPMNTLELKKRKSMNYVDVFNRPCEAIIIVVLMSNQKRRETKRTLESQWGWMSLTTASVLVCMFNQCRCVAQSSCIFLSLSLSVYWLCYSCSSGKENSTGSARLKRRSRRSSDECFLRRQLMSSRRSQWRSMGISLTTKTCCERASFSSEVLDR